MKILINAVLAATMGLSLLATAAPASAQGYGHGGRLARRRLLARQQRLAWRLCAP